MIASGNCAAVPDEERNRTIFWLHYQQGMSAESHRGLARRGTEPKGRGERNSSAYSPCPGADGAAPLRI